MYAFTTIVVGMSGNATIAAGLPASAYDTITSLPGSTQNIVIAAGYASSIDLTGNSGVAAVIGAAAVAPAHPDARPAPADIFFKFRRYSADYFFLEFRSIRLCSEGK